MHLCDCGFLMTIEYSAADKKYMYKCSQCDNKKNATGILYSKRNSSRESFLQKQIRAAFYDQTCATADRTCSKCNNHPMRYVLDYDTMKRIYVCHECKKYEQV